MASVAFHRRGLVDGARSARRPGEECLPVMLIVEALPLAPIADEPVGAKSHQRRAVIPVVALVRVLDGAGLFGSSKTIRCHTTW